MVLKNTVFKKMVLKNSERRQFASSLGLTISEVGKRSVKEVLGNKFKEKYLMYKVILERCFCKPDRFERS